MSPYLKMSNKELTEMEKWFGKLDDYYSSPAGEIDDWLSSLDCETLRLFCKYYLCSISELSRRIRDNSFDSMR